MVGEIMIKGVIFDLDGVIIDSEPLHEQCEREILKQFGAILTPDIFAEVKGLRDQEAFHYYTRRFNLKEKPEVLMQKKMQLYMKLLKKNMRPCPGFKDFAKQCKQKFKIGLATSSSKENVAFIIKELEIKHLFDAIVTGEEVNLPKPYPDPYLKMAEKLHLKANQCLVIEDSIHGITAAKTAGAKCIAVSTTFPKKKLKATSVDHIVPSLRKLHVNFIKKM